MADSLSRLLILRAPLAVHGLGRIRCPPLGSANGPVGGMMNLGPRPTFGDLATSLEVHLFDTDGDLYGAQVRVDFVARLRETRKFASAEQLSKQLAHDERDARSALTLLSSPRNLNG